MADGGGHLFNRSFILNNELAERITYKEIKCTVVVSPMMVSVRAAEHHMINNLVNSIKFKCRAPWTGL